MDRLFRDLGSVKLKFALRGAFFAVWLYITVVILLSTHLLAEHMLKHYRSFADLAYNVAFFLDFSELFKWKQ